jgi:hypothetical protein
VLAVFQHVLAHAVLLGEENSHGGGGCKLETYRQKRRNSRREDGRFGNWQDVRAHGNVLTKLRDRVRPMWVAQAFKRVLGWEGGGAGQWIINVPPLMCLWYKSSSALSLSRQPLRGGGGMARCCKKAAARQTRYSRGSKRTMARCYSYAESPPRCREQSGLLQCSAFTIDNPPNPIGTAGSRADRPFVPTRAITTSPTTSTPSRVTPAARTPQAPLASLSATTRPLTG